MMLFFSIYLLLLASRGTLRRNLRFDFCLCLSFPFASDRHDMWIRVHKCAPGSPASSRCLSQCSCVSPLTTNCRPVFFTGEISPKRETKNQKNSKMKIFLKGFQIARSKSQIKIKNKNRQIGIFRFPVCSQLYRIMMIKRFVLHIWFIARFD